MNRACRQGWTLIEVVISIALTSVITGMVVTLLTTLLEFDRRSTELQNESTSFARLADQFRSDVRAASSIQQEAVTEEETLQRITLSLSQDTRVVYQQQGDRLLRTFYQGEQPSGQESYDLPESAQVRLHESPTAVGEVATLMLDYPLRQEPESKRRQRLITSALGRDLGWSSRQEENQP